MNRMSPSSADIKPQIRERDDQAGVERSIVGLEDVLGLAPSEPRAEPPGTPCRSLADDGRTATAPAPDAPLVEWALHWASRDFYVFPLTPNANSPPLIGEWQKLATRDAAQILAWWSDCPDANIGAVPAMSGHFVVDLDTKKGKNGAAELALLEENNGKLPTTWTVATPTGGRHLWFSGVAPTSAGRIASGIDVRGGWGDEKGYGYVVLPPSVRPEGRYTLDTDAPMAMAPQWLLKVAAKPANLPYRNAVPGVVLNAPANIQRATEWLQQQPGAVEFQGSDDATIRVANVVGDYGCDAEVTVDLMMEQWVPRCEGDWDEVYISDKVCSAFRSRQNDLGCDAPDPRPLHEIFAGPLAALLANTAQSAEPTDALWRPEIERLHARFRSYDEDEFKNLPPIKVYLENLLIDGPDTYLLSGQLGTYKTFALLEIAMAVTSGKPCFGKLNLRGCAGPAVLFMSEASRAVMTKRWPALRTARGIASEMKLPINIVCAVPALSRSGEADFCKEQIKRIEDKAGEKMRLIGFDTLSRMLAGLSENDNTSAALATDTAEDFANTFECPVWINAHMGKDTSRNTRGHSGQEANIGNVFHIEADPLEHRQGCARQWAAIKPYRLKDAPDWQNIYLAGRKIIEGGANTGFTLDGVGQEEFDRISRGAGGAVEARAHCLRVGAMLRDQGIFGAEKSLSLNALATLLAGDPRTMSEEALEAARAREYHLLNNGARSRGGKPARLEGYYEEIAWPLGSNKFQRRFFLPADGGEGQA